MHSLILILCTIKPKLVHTVLPKFAHTVCTIKAFLFFDHLYFHLFVEIYEAMVKVEHSFYSVTQTYTRSEVFFVYLYFVWY